MLPNDESRSTGKSAALDVVHPRRGESTGAASADISASSVPLPPSSALFPMDAQFVTTKELLRVTDSIGAAHFAWLSAA
jgi:hypothetical protein